MAQFTLVWSSDDIVANSNATSQRMVYRYKGVGGSFINPGDLAKDVETVDSPVLDDNKIVQFKVQCNCTANGPTDNDNGIQEMIGFACIVPTIGKTYNSSTVTLSLTGLDITKVKFTLRKASDNTLVGSAVIVNVVSSSASTTKTGLTESTNYYWQIELYTTINNIEVISSDPAFIGSLCSPYAFQTDALPACNPLTSVTVTSIEIP